MIMLTEIGSFIMDVNSHFDSVYAPKELGLENPFWANMKAYRENNSKCGLMLETIEDIHFFLLRLSGVKFEAYPQDIPMFTYESVGYGCFYD